MGGDAPVAMTFVWTMFGVLTLFLLLRLYTRVVLLAALGYDDYLYISAYVRPDHATPRLLPPHQFLLPRTTANAVPKEKKSN